ncbi:MAG: pantoate--beta-alanine ligase [Gammaproteobacteria bacterium TMED78]|nr:MAG: pantoate--beta-alanine ligase [Gammaproteobacteria bacterium TMED78]|tara:strand:- start:39599 stop:40477 length:879 start_codon:yes stop_codon:yes gene_type:complete
MSKIFKIQNKADLLQQRDIWKKNNQSIALVPTMGNLHHGHMKLIETASKYGDKVVCTIFVNPTQFEKEEDLNSYPRTLKEDKKKIELQDIADLIFFPTKDMIYPNRIDESTQIKLPSLSKDLCGKFRPNHFSGVASVLIRLINIITPDTMILGDKDLQQKILVSQMLQDMHYDHLKIISHPIVREQDGLAMSSRNSYLTIDERRVAPNLYKKLSEISQDIINGEENYDVLISNAKIGLEEDGFKIDYLTIRNYIDLKLPNNSKEELVIMCAAYLGKTRLIDNICFRAKASYS